MRKTTSKQTGKPFTGKDDPRRLSAPKGNKHAVGHVAKAKDFITQQLIATLNENATNYKTATSAEKTKYAKMVRAVVTKALHADPWAVEFIFDRVEGKVPATIKSSINVTLARAIPMMSDAELEAMESAGRKALAADPNIIDVTPE